MGKGHTQNTLVMRHRDVIRRLINKIFFRSFRLGGDVVSWSVEMTSGF